MARITDEIDVATEEGTRPSLQTVTPTDFGLREASQEFGQAATATRRADALQIRAQAATDQRSIAPDVTAYVNATKEDAAMMAAKYQPGQGGLAAAVSQVASDRAEAFAKNPKYTPGQRTEFRNKAVQLQQQFAEEAGTHQANVDAAPAAEQAANLAAQPINDALVAQAAAFEPAANKIRLAHAAGDADLLPATLAAYDASTAQVVDAAPDAAKPYITAKLAAGRAVVAANTLNYAIETANHQTTVNIARQTAELVNTVTETPGAYDNAVSTLAPAIVNGSPVAYRDAISHDLMGQLATARIRGLVAHGQPALAQQEIKAGNYNKVLDGPTLQSLSAETDAAVRGNAPMSVDQGIKHDQTVLAAQANLTSILTTGKETTGATLDQVAGILSQNETVAYAQARTQALTQFAAVGSVRAMSATDLAAVRSKPAPDASDPNYASDLMGWQAQQKAAADEQTARAADPAAWAFDASSKAPATKGMAAVGTGAAQTRGDALQQAWQGVLAPTDGSGHAAGAHLAGWSLGAQYAAGIPSAQRTVVPQAYAAQVAAGITNAPPEGRLQAMASVSAIMGRLPNSITLPDGSIANPRAMFGQQLMKAGLNASEYSALVDFGGDPSGAKLGRVVAAENVAGQKPLDKNDKLALTAAVTSQLAPYLAQVKAMPGEDQLYQARIDRTVLVAHGLMVNQGMSVGAAAKAAAGDLTLGYQDMGTFRVPSAVVHSGGGDVSVGAAHVLQALTADGGKGLLPTPNDGTGLTAAKVQQAASWRTLPDQTGLVLMFPKTDGTYTPVLDRFGRSVQLGWNDLKAASQNITGLNARFTTPPPGNPVHTDGTPIPAFSKSQGFNALAAGIEHNESRGRTGLISDAGAYGVRQVLPDAARPYAQKLFGQPLDLHRLQWDDAYNRQISNAILGDLVNHYGTGSGLGLAAAAYFAGQGNVDGYTDAKGAYHPGLIQTHGDPRKGGVSLDQWVRGVGAKSPLTAKYVPGALYYALSQLKGQH